MPTQKLSVAAQNLCVAAQRPHRILRRIRGWKQAFVWPHRRRMWPHRSCVRPHRWKMRPHKLTDQILRNVRPHRWKMRPHVFIKARKLKEFDSVRPHRGRTKAAQSPESQFFDGLSIFGCPIHVPWLKIDHGIMGDVHRRVNWQKSRPYRRRKGRETWSNTHNLQQKSFSLSTLLSPQP